MSKNKSNVLAIGIMFFLFAMISFVTGLQNPFAIIVKNQFEASNAMAQLGNAANFIAYAFLGLPAGFLLKRKGYKFTALSAVAVGFIGVGISFLSGVLESFTVYLIGAFVSGFSMCMLNTVVNPMLNTLGGGGNRGNQLIQLGGSCNSLAATICPVFVGYLIGDAAKAKISDADPALFIAMGIFVLAFIIIYFSNIPEPDLEASKSESNEVQEGTFASIKGALSYRHFVFGIIAIFLYVGIEVGIPNTLNNYLTTLDKEQLAVKIEKNNQLLSQVLAAPAEETVAPAPEAEAPAAPEAETPAPAAETVAPAAETPATPEAEAVVPAAESESNTVDVKAILAENEVKTVEELNTKLTEENTANQAKIDDPNYQEGLGKNADFAGAVVAVYWFLMLIGRLVGGAIGGKVSSRVMITLVSSVAILLISLGVLLPDITVKFPSLDTATLAFSMVDVPVCVMLFVLCGLCTSVMWGAIFNLAVEGLGKYTSIASGLFMVMVCGGGILPLLQGVAVDMSGFMNSYWVLVAALVYMLWFGVLGSKIRK